MSAKSVRFDLPEHKESTSDTSSARKIDPPFFIIRRSVIEAPDLVTQIDASKSTSGTNKIIIILLTNRLMDAMIARTTCVRRKPPSAVHLMDRLEVVFAEALTKYFSMRISAVYSEMDRSSRSRAIKRHRFGKRASFITFPMASSFKDCKHLGALEDIHMLSDEAEVFIHGSPLCSDAGMLTFLVTRESSFHEPSYGPPTAMRTRDLAMLRARVSTSLSSDFSSDRPSRCIICVDTTDGLPEDCDRAVRYASCAMDVRPAKGYHTVRIPDEAWSKQPVSYLTFWTNEAVRASSQVALTITDSLCLRYLKGDL